MTMEVHLNEALKVFEELVLPVRIHSIWSAAVVCKFYLNINTAQILFFHFIRCLLLVFYPCCLIMGAKLQ